MMASEKDTAQTEMHLFYVCFNESFSSPLEDKYIEDNSEILHKDA